MAASMLGSKSLKEYLRRYESNTGDEKGKKKKKKKIKPEPSGVLVVDQDPVWQKPVNLEEENADDSPDEEKPVIDEDIEVKRMRRLEELRARRPYDAISEDGSGWVSLSSKPSISSIPDLDISPPRKHRVRNDTPSPEPRVKHLDSRREGEDLSPPRQKRHHSPAPDTRGEDFSPPRKQKVRYDTPSPGRELEHLDSRKKDDDLSPPRHRRHRHSSSFEPVKSSEISLPHRSHHQTSNLNQRRQDHTPELSDISPPRSGCNVSDVSPPRKGRKNVRRPRSPEISARGVTTETGASRISLPPDLSPSRKIQKKLPPPASLKEQPKTGLISGRDIREEISKTKKDDWLRLKEMDPSITGAGAEPIYRDKTKGERISKEDFLKSRQKVEEKPKEITLEWGKGLAQKREAEARIQELELEKDKPFARTRDDPELDKLRKDTVRWGDPMAHLVKKNHHDPVLPNLGESEKMQESGFIIPQEIPAHSWLKRGFDAAPNRYGIKPGRHWDGVDRSNGFEKEMFKRTNTRQASEREAYLWSVSDM